MSTDDALVDIGVLWPNIGGIGPNAVRKQPFSRCQVSSQNRMRLHVVPAGNCHLPFRQHSGQKMEGTHAAGRHAGRSRRARRSRHRLQNLLYANRYNAEEPLVK